MAIQTFSLFPSSPLLLPLLTSLPRCLIASLFRCFVASLPHCLAAPLPLLPPPASLALYCGTAGISYSRPVCKRRNKKFQILNFLFRSVLFTVPSSSCVVCPGTMMQHRHTVATLKSKLPGPPLFRHFTINKVYPVRS